MFWLFWFCVWDGAPHMDRRTQVLTSLRTSLHTQLMGTQLFSSFIQRRMEASDPHILFFDSCMVHSQTQPHPPNQRLLIDRVEALGAAASPSSSRLNSSSPAPLSLLVRSTSYSHTPPVTPSTPTTDSAEAETAEPASPPPRFATTGLLRKMSSSLALTRLPSFREQEAAIAAASSSAVSVEEEEGQEKEGTTGGGGVVVVECRPSTEGLPPGERFSYCERGFLAWPQRLDDRCVDFGGGVIFFVSLLGRIAACVCIVIPKHETI